MLKKLFCVVLSLFFVFSLIPGSGAAEFVFADVPAYSGEPAAEVNGGVPFFTESDKTTKSFETYSELDALGRCGAAFAVIGFDLMPTEERGSIGSVKPTGWQYAKYDVVDGKYLYNRCHLIGYQLTAENANRQNLITGTRYLNVVGMLPYENLTANYIKSEYKEGNEVHVLYRVTPVFTGDNLVADGVLMEALSVEDNGKAVCFCVFCYNVQPGIVINYADGTSRLKEEGEAEKPPKTYELSICPTLVLNASTKKFHLPTCSSAKNMSAKNRKEVTEYPADLIENGYMPCSVCRPEEQTEKAVYYYGDADLDGKLTAGDARIALRTAVGLDHPEGTPLILLDVDADNAVTAGDARIILRAAVGLEKIA